MENLIRLMSRNTIKLSIPGENCPEVGRFGGLPDVPPGFVWPYFETDTYEDKEVKPHPLSFIAQFDCAALANMDTEGLLPHEGILSFFYEMESQCWGFDPKNAGCAKVYWFPDKSVLAPASFPEDLQDYNRFPDFPIRGSRQISYPDYSDAFPNGYDPENPDNYEEYEKVFAGLAGKGEGEPFHKLLGWPNIIQNNMTQQCELVSRGHTAAADGITFQRKTAGQRKKFPKRTGGCCSSLIPLEKGISPWISETAAAFIFISV